MISGGIIFDGVSCRFVSLCQKSPAFSLIELLIAVSILGLLAVITFSALNPAKRQNQAKDSQTRADIGQIATALSAYFTSSGRSTYPTASQGLNQLATNQDLTKVPTPPAGGSYEYGVSPPTCDNTPGNLCTAAYVSEPLLDPATAGNVWCWESAEGKAEEETMAACTDFDGST